jgi:nicotinate-nucleotide--dimethylbenzimidazole phosphoribosyltransferase
MVGAAAARVPVIVDGFICGAAALIAARLRPEARAYFALSHLSAEQGHRAVCSELGLTPLFDLGMRLGEGTGAALASHLVMAAVEAQARMATFDSAGVPDRDG